MAGIIHCCGMACFDKFSNLSSEEINSVNRTNINSVVLMGKLLTDNLEMKSGDGRIFFISMLSSVEDKTHRYVSAYAASKAYQKRFVMNLESEL